MQPRRIYPGRFDTLRRDNRLLLSICRSSSLLLDQATRMQCDDMRLLVLIASLLITASCLHSTGDPALTYRSDFQSRLDALGIPLSLPPGRSILVNIPHYELIAFENGDPVFRSRVIVGSTRNPTPRIDTHVSRVTFRPSWRPTPGMVASGEYQDRVRPPGQNNPLGLAAVRLEPGLLVYLHDTNQRALFGREMRALSHGCIRVERWEHLIAWLLDRDEAWVRQMALTPPTKEVPAPRVPVLIRYFPVFPAEDGRLLRYADIYGLQRLPAKKRSFIEENRVGCSS